MTEEPEKTNTEEEKIDGSTKLGDRFQWKFHKIEERLEKLEDNHDDDWIIFIDELSEIEEAFGTKELCGKTILDIGTYGIKPLYIALKYKPMKIIGINEEVDSEAAIIEQKSKLFLKTEIKFYDCSFFNQAKLQKIIKKEELPEEKPNFDFVLVSKTLHHLRSGPCIAKGRDPEHCCNEVEKGCIYEFNKEEIFERLLCLGKRLIVYEAFFPGEKDDDKERGRGEYFTTCEWKQIFEFLERSEKYRVKLIQPTELDLNKEGLMKMDAILRQVETLCFYVETRAGKLLLTHDVK